MNLENIKTSFAILITLCAGAAYFHHGQTRPAYNWDILAYVAASYDSQSPDEVHRATFNKAKEKIPEKDFKELLSGSDYRRTMATDPKAFASMMPLYEVKPGYLAALKVTARLVDPVTATWTISAFSMAVASILLGLLLLYQNSTWLLSVAIPITYLLKWPLLAGLGTPDALALSALLIALLAWQYNRVLGTWLCLPLIFIRLDILILHFLLIAFNVTLKLNAYNKLNLHLVCSGAASLLIYLTTSAWANHPGWWTHFYFTNIEIQPHLHTFSQPFDLSLYLGTLLHKSRTLTSSAWHMAGFAMIVVGLLNILFQRRGNLKSFDTFFTSTSLYLIIRFTLFPHTGPRLYVAGFTIAFLYLLLEADKTLQPLVLGRSQPPTLEPRANK